MQRHARADTDAVTPAPDRLRCFASICFRTQVYKRPYVPTPPKKRTPEEEEARQEKKARKNAKREYPESHANPTWRPHGHVDVAIIPIYWNMRKVPAPVPQRGPLSLRHACVLFVFVLFVAHLPLSPSLPISPALLLLLFGGGGPAWANMCCGLCLACRPAVYSLEPACVASLAAKQPSPPTAAAAHRGSHPSAHAMRACAQRRLTAPPAAAVLCPPRRPPAPFRPHRRRRSA